MRTRMIRGTVAAAALVVGLMFATGCDDYGTGYYDPYGYDSWGSDWGGGYGPIDDDVFQNSVDAWSDYFRG